MSEDMVYGCDTCRTTLGRAGCPTHRDSNTYTDAAGAYHYTGSQLVMTHCIHGLDLRLHPRCYLCTPDAEIARLRRIEEAARAVAECCAVEESWGGQESDDLCASHTALRAALEEKP